MAATGTSFEHKYSGTSHQNPTRIFICGAHSVGKTTLAEALAVETGFHLVSEVARTIIKEMGLKRDDYDPRSKPSQFKELQQLILASQAEIESRNDRLKRSYICDRAIDPVVYAMVYLGEKEAKDLLQQETTKQNITRYRSSLIFVIKPYPECISHDDVRLPPNMDELNVFTSTMENLLRELQIPYTLIDTLDLKERVQIIKEQIDRQ
ncbi:hypothetical protein QZH41_013808 [Actinostola sp. cb2023]|nr:hypothetical protein QZH41_013808 [Actinostola sp. cb2023]